MNSIPQAACNYAIARLRHTPRHLLNRGTPALSRLTDDATWSYDDVEFPAQVANQIAIVVDNSLYRELSEMKERLATEKLYLEDEIRLDQNIGNMVGGSAAFQTVLKSVQLVAPTDSTVLVLGETGTGKELFARTIHEVGGRKQGSFVKVNCAAIPASLLESERFGREKGAFTGAVAQKLGRFERAHNWTLSWMRSAKCRSNSNPSCSARYRIKSSSGSAALGPSGQTPGWLPRQIGTSRHGR